MRPHEETWDVGTYGGLFVWSNVEDRNGSVPVGQFYAEARARLAAQAPAMARLLLEALEARDHGSNGTRQGCPTCEPILAVLKEAGVLP